MAPDIRLDLLDAGNGQVLINWITKDAALVPQTLMIEFADGTDGRWKSVPLTAAASGQTSVQAPAGSMVSVRSAVQDAAGNQGETSAQLELRSATPAANVVPGNQFSKSTAAPLGPSPFPGMNAAANPAAPGSNSSAISSTSNPSSAVGGVNPAGGVPQIQSGPASSGFCTATARLYRRADCVV